MNNVVLQANEIRKSYGGVHALKGVSLSLQRGEVHALAGENGAGKSTLIKILAGATSLDSGQIFLNQELITHNSPSRARALGIGIVYQQPALFPDLTVAENITLAGESSQPWRRVNWRTRRALAADLLRRVGAGFSADTIAGTLTAPEQQLVEIAKALDAKPAVLILDEPTATLGEQDAENLFRIVRELQAQDTTIVYITHRFEELFRLANRVTVLRDGEAVDTCNVRDLTRNSLISMMVGREVSSVYPTREKKAGKVALEVRNLACHGSGVKNASLEVHYGEIVGLAGLVGSGRTQLAECIFGLTKKDAGEILIEGKHVHMESPRDAIQHSIAYVPEDRRKHGLILDMSIASNTTLSSLAKISNWGLLKLNIEQQSAGDFSRRMRVKTPSVDTLAGDLSGGNQQKVALARWLMTEPKILILDEPTQGIDVGAKAEIYALMNELADRGIAILMISSDMNEILGMSDRIVVMSKGESAGELNRGEATAESVLQCALGYKDYVLKGRASKLAFRREWPCLVALLLLAALMLAAAPGFYSIGNLRDMLLANAPLLLVASGMTFVIIVAQIDISVRSLFGVTALACGALAQRGCPMAALPLLILLMGAALGAINAGLVAYVGVPSIVVTLATMVIWREALRWVSGGAWIEGLPANFQWLGLGQSIGRLSIIGISLVIFLFLTWASRHLWLARAVFATGSDREAARVAGVPVKQVVFWVFVLMGALTGLASFLNAVRFSDVPANSGMNLELKAIAAVVVGGTPITGGKGTLPGTLLGVALLGCLGPALVYLGINPFWEKAIQGAIILFTVPLEAFLSHRRMKEAVA